MIYSFKAIVWRLVFVYVFVQSVHADIFGEFVRTTGTDPAFVRMGTTYIPQYLSRNEGYGNGIVGRFHFGEESRKVQGQKTRANDDSHHCFIKRRKMDKGEYREFKDMSLFFREEDGEPLYKIVIERTFPCESQARDRATIINGVIEDCRQHYGLVLNRTVECDGRVVYQCSDDVFEIRMELSKTKEGGRCLSLSVMNKMVRDGKAGMSPQSSKPVFNADRDIEVSI